MYGQDNQRMEIEQAGGGRRQAGKDESMHRRRLHPRDHMDSGGYLCAIREGGERGAREYCRNETHELGRAIVRMRTVKGEKGEGEGTSQRQRLKGEKDVTDMGKDYKKLGEERKKEWAHVSSHEKAKHEQKQTRRKRKHGSRLKSKATGSMTGRRERDDVQEHRTMRGV